MFNVVTKQNFKVWHKYLPFGNYTNIQLFICNKYSPMGLRLRPILKLCTLDIFYFLTVPKGIDISLISNNRLVVFTSANSLNRKYLLAFSTLLATTVLSKIYTFKVLLKVRGLGYKVFIKNQGKEIHLRLGLSHTAIFKLPSTYFAQNHGIKDRMFSIEGPEWVGITTIGSKIRSLRKVDIYRGKGIFKKFTSYSVRQSKKKKK